MERKYPVITISREYASGGRTVAGKLSELLGIPFYDRDFVKKTAVESGYSVEEIEEEGEGITPAALRMERFLGNAMVYPSSYDAIYKAQSEVLLELAQSPCIIIGRCADHILTQAGIPAFKVFLYADEAHRIERARELLQMSDTEAVKHIIAKMDVKRNTYYQRYAGREMGDYTTYHIALDTGAIGYEKCAEILAQIVQEKSK